MTATRADRLERLHRVQRRKREMEEWRLADLQRRDAALAGEAEEILQSLGSQSLMNGLFLEAKANSLRRKEAERAALRSLEEGVKQRLALARRLEKQIETVSGDARRFQNAADESARLNAVLDSHLTALRASLE